MACCGKAKKMRRLKEERRRKLKLAQKKRAIEIKKRKEAEENGNELEEAYLKGDIQ